MRFAYENLCATTIPRKTTVSIPNQILDETSQKNFNLSLAAKLRKLYLLALFRENDLFDRQLLALFG